MVVPRQHWSLWEQNSIFATVSFFKENWSDLHIVGKKMFSFGKKNIYRGNDFSSEVCITQVFSPIDPKS